MRVDLDALEPFVTAALGPPKTAQDGPYADFQIVFTPTIAKLLIEELRESREQLASILERVEEVLG